MYFNLFFYLIILALLLPFSSGENLKREKRFLLYYPFGGGVKLVLGFATPVPLGLKQSMAWGWNFQFQYNAAQTTNNTMVYPPIISRSREKRQVFDRDRSVFYAGIEAVLDRNGFNGRACLLRSICANALTDLNHEANGLFGHILHIALTPDSSDASDLDPVYLEAKKAGEFGVECASLYPDCQQVEGFLSMISLLDE